MKLNEIFEDIQAKTKYRKASTKEINMMRSFMETHDEENVNFYDEKVKRDSSGSWPQHELEKAQHKFEAMFDFDEALVWSSDPVFVPSKEFKGDQRLASLGNHDIVYLKNKKPIAWYEPGQVVGYIQK